MLANQPSDGSLHPSSVSTEQQPIEQQPIEQQAVAEQTAGAEIVTVTLSEQSVFVPSSRMFAHPTRLLCAWEPRLMQIHLPESTKRSAAITIMVQQGVTQAANLDTGRSFRTIYKRLYKRFMPPLRLEGSYVFDGRYETDQNIAHLVDNVLIRFLLARRAYPQLANLTLILRRNASDMVKMACEALRIPFLCTDRAVQGNVVKVQSELRSASHPIIFDPHYRAVFGVADIANYSAETPKRVFIARKLRRRLVNEAEVEQTLKEYGFVKVYYEDIPVAQQWSIARNAEVVVGIHGAALSSLAFNASHVKLLELFHPGYIVDIYRDLVAAIGGSWAGVMGQLQPEVVQALDFQVKPREFAFADLTIDLQSLRLGLEHLGVGLIEDQDRAVNGTK
jgi:capsular polysaccharide biosynthesis protein